jgi:hypothetical protein
MYESEEKTRGNFGARQKAGGVGVLSAKEQNNSKTIYGLHERDMAGKQRHVAWPLVTTETTRMTIAAFSYFLPLKKLYNN